MSTAKRPTAPRQAKPAQRYFRGKAPASGPGAAHSDSDSDSDSGADEEEGGDAVRYEEGDVPVSGVGSEDGDEDEDEDDGGAPVSASAPVRRSVQTQEKGSGRGTMNVSLKDVSISEGKVIVSGRVESGRTEREVQGVFHQ